MSVCSNRYLKYTFFLQINKKKSNKPTPKWLHVLLTKNKNILARWQFRSGPCGDFAEDGGPGEAAELQRQQHELSTSARPARHMRAHTAGAAVTATASATLSPQHIPPSRGELPGFINPTQGHLKFSLVRGHTTAEHYFSSNSHHNRSLYSINAFPPL